MKIVNCSLCINDNDLDIIENIDVNFSDRNSKSIDVKTVAKGYSGLTDNSNTIQFNKCVNLSVGDRFELFDSNGESIISGSIVASLIRNSFSFKKL